MQGNQHWQSCSPMLLVTGHLPLTSQLIGWRASVITKLNNGNFTAPSRDVIFLHLEFGLKFTKGNNCVYQKNIQIPAAPELSIESYSLSFASSFEGHVIHALFLFFSFQVAILTPSHASSLPFLKNLWRVLENSKKKNLVQQESKKWQQWTSFSFFSSSSPSSWS